VSGDDWQSSTDVWTSTDAVHWALVDAAPPFIHYCSYISWRGRMWAIGPASFSSADGRTWQPEQLSAPALNRSVVYGDRVFSITGATVRVSDDGRTWRVLTDTGPWGDREQPNVLVFRDRLWVLGGVSRYGTPTMQIWNDVWSSTDGVHWELVTPVAGWSPRHWSSAIVFDGRIFVVNGWNPAAWPDGNGNTDEVWYSDDGVEWARLPSERRWSARHASFSAVAPGGGLVLAAGYGSAGVQSIYNDVWRIDARLYFPKPSGRLDVAATWGRNMDGSGAGPASFDAPNQVFVLRNRATFHLPKDWRPSGAGSVLVVGDGVRGVTLEASAATVPIGPVYVTENSTLIVRPGYADVRVLETGAQLVLAPNSPQP
jgi:hypothetical protein